MRVHNICIGLLSFALFSIGCGTDQPATFSRIQAEVLTPSCALASCHSDRARAGKLILEDGVSFGALVNIDSNNASAASMALKRVVPGDPAQSFFFIKLSQPLERSFGTVMPSGTDGLDSSRLQLISDWISAGAKND